MSLGILRNKNCPCGSGRKFKKCCLLKAEGYINEDKGIVKVSDATNSLPIDATLQDLKDYLKDYPLKGKPYIVMPIDWYSKNLELFAKEEVMHVNQQDLLSARLSDNGYIGMFSDIMYFTSSLLDRNEFNQKLNEQAKELASVKSQTKNRENTPPLTTPPPLK